MARCRWPCNIAEAVLFARRPVKVLGQVDGRQSEVSYVSFDGDQASFWGSGFCSRGKATGWTTFEQFCGSVSVTWRELVAAAWLAPAPACLCSLPAASLLACYCCCSASAGYEMLGERGLPWHFGAHQLHCEACGHHIVLYDWLAASETAFCCPGILSSTHAGSCFVQVCELCL